jgi:hypothetical protein
LRNSTLNTLIIQKIRRWWAFYQLAFESIVKCS